MWRAPLWRSAPFTDIFQDFGQISAAHQFARGTDEVAIQSAHTDGPGTYVILTVQLKKTIPIRKKGMLFLTRDGLHSGSALRCKTGRPALCS